MADDSRLFDDVKAMDKVPREIALRADPTLSSQAPAALERGVRERPDGTRETYERVEYRKD